MELHAATVIGEIMEREAKARPCSTPSVHAGVQCRSLYEQSRRWYQRSAVGIRQDDNRACLSCRGYHFGIQSHSSLGRLMHFKFASTPRPARPPSAASRSTCPAPVRVTPEGRPERFVRGVSQVMLEDNTGPGGSPSFLIAVPASLAPNYHLLNAIRVASASNTSKELRTIAIPCRLVGPPG
jgi:hypothetical protein